MEAETLPEWVVHRANKLGLTGSVGWNAASDMEIFVSGPDDLIDAFEIACSLGPFNSHIEGVDRLVVNQQVWPNTFQNLCAE